MIKIRHIDGELHCVVKDKDAARTTYILYVVLAASLSFATQCSYNFHASKFDGMYRRPFSEGHSVSPCIASLNLRPSGKLKSNQSVKSLQISNLEH